MRRSNNEDKDDCNDSTSISSFKNSIVMILTITIVFCLFVLVGSLTSTSTPRLYRGRAPRQSV